MKLHLNKLRGQPLILIQARAEGKGAVGDFVHYVEEGEKFGKYTYDELVVIAATKGFIIWKGN
jgi:hypothetical protein